MATRNLVSILETPWHAIDEESVLPTATFGCPLTSTSMHVARRSFQADQASLRNSIRLLNGQRLMPSSETMDEDGVPCSTIRFVLLAEFVVRLPKLTFAHAEPRHD